jgi:hypothetical protein
MDQAERECVRDGVQEPPAEAASQHRGLWSAAMQPGVVIGEAALLAHTRRMVSVYANPGSTLLRLTRESHAAAVSCPPPLPVTDAIYRMLKVTEVSVVCDSTRSSSSRQSVQSNEHWKAAHPRPSYVSRHHARNTQCSS